MFVFKLYFSYFTLKTNEFRLSNSDNRPISVWSSCNSIGFDALNTNDVEAILKISPGTFLWIPNTSTKYCVFGTKPVRVCLFRRPVQARAVPRFESIFKRRRFKMFLLSIFYGTIYRGQLPTNSWDAFNRLKKVIIECGLQSCAENFWRFFNHIIDGIAECFLILICIDRQAILHYVNVQFTIEI